MAFPSLAQAPDAPLHWHNPLQRTAFDAQIATILAAIARGEVYQINHTTQLEASYTGDPFALFCALHRAQPVANAAFLAHGAEAVLSVSPELFFDWDGERILCRPMKGTAPRGATPEEDQRQAQALQASAKERAENVMIVDLIRNDLSRVARGGAVQVTDLFACEPWPTLWQMTSGVEARPPAGTGLADIFQALFPCGSVIGAPKLRAMHWINALEPQARGVYCGAVGVVLPGGAARFNVPIRTVTVAQGRAVCGIGSGITAGSTAEGEWAEWACKSHFLAPASQPFQLLQTLRVQDGVAQHLALHLARLVAAARHFGFAFDAGHAQAAVQQAAAGTPPGTQRLRVLVDLHGTVTLDPSGMPPTPAGLLEVALATHPMDAPPAFLLHKTTHRAHYEGFSAPGTQAFDTLLWNTRGEITEFTRGNVVVELADGRRVTPPLHCGLLDGVGRARALASGEVQERVVHKEDLPGARGLWFVNALRGERAVRLTWPAQGA